MYCHCESFDLNRPGVVSDRSVLDQLSVNVLSCCMAMNQNAFSKYTFTVSVYYDNDRCIKQYSYFAQTSPGHPVVFVNDHVQVKSLPLANEKCSATTLIIPKLSARVVRRCIICGENETLPAAICSVF